MKAGILTCAGVVFLQLVVAAPSHGRAHKHKRVVETQVVYENVGVYVHDDGVPFSTAFEVKTEVSGVADPTGAPSDHPSVAAPQPTAQSSAPVNTPKPAPPSVAASFPVPSAPSAPAPAPSAPSPAAQASGSAQAPSSNHFKNGIAYSPYKADNNCRDAGQVASDLAKLKSYSVVRIYGVDCSQVQNVLAALKGSNTQVFAGIFDIHQVEAEAKSMIEQVGKNWNMINTVSVGNELVNNGAAVGDVTAAIGTARTLLRAAGYQGPVVTVDTMNSMKSHMELCEASDYCAINCHAFFDGHVQPQDAGKFVSGWVSDISKLSKGKKVVVTESGWPNSGSRNVDAVPSPDNQKKAMASLQAAFPQDLIQYSAFDNAWMKDNVKTFNAEKHWGILGQAPSTL